LFEDIKCSVDEFFTELLNKTSHAIQAHILKFRGWELNDIEDNINECVNDLSEDENLIINEVLPDLTSL